MKKNICIILIALFFAPAAVHAAEQPLILGVLEELPDETWDGIPDHPPTITYSSKVRVLFQKDGDDWKAFPWQYDDLNACHANCHEQPICKEAKKEVIQKLCMNACNNEQQRWEEKLRSSQKSPCEKCWKEKLQPCQNCTADCNTKFLTMITTHYPAEVDWTIAFSGKNLGQVTSQKLQSLKYFSEVGLQDIVGTAPIPTIGKRSAEYRTWLGDSMHRPLIAVSQPNFKDPEEWKPAKLSPDLIKLVRKAFRQKFPQAYNCTNPNENVAKPWDYADRDMKILKAYSSKKNWTIVHTALDISKLHCDYAIQEGDPFNDQWFAVSPTGEVSYLDEGMQLVDAGDYDNDGKSELLFTVSGEARGGYELFYDDFTKHTVFDFHYH